MKQFFAALLTAAMVFSATACTQVNKEFKKLTDDLSSAVKAECGSSKASKVQENQFKSNSFDPSSLTFRTGAYYTCEKKDVKVSDLGSKVVEAGDFTDIYMFCKSSDDSYILAQVTALKKEGMATDYFEELVSDLGSDMTEENLEQMKEAYGIDYGFSESDNEYAVVLRQEESDIAEYIYIKVDGKVVTAWLYEGSYSDALLSEYNAVMERMDFIDMEALVKE